ncbi:Protein of unknown function DUF2347 [Ceraceosorus bombacis]|uniref:Uncharacterized protein n=1 Tax=Ceraceosorus bombacis TaxID=401625 RepID=A0A0P1BND2_9BASI|nr:Protein of unknown function DUF2347 [Ceraceosorus bombacis]
MTHLDLAPSTSSSSALQVSAPRNVRQVFLAEFDERKGPTIVFAHPLPAPNLEWRSLPSGSHALEHPDIISFLTENEDEHSVVAAVVRSRSTAGEEGAESRGNRVITVGAVLACADSTPASHHFASTLHTAALTQLAERLSYTPNDTAALREWQTNLAQSDSGTSADSEARKAAGDARRLRSPNDSLLSLPSLSSALGPLLPVVLKRCLTPHHRLLIFSPAGVPTSRALTIHSALAELAHAAGAFPLARGLLALPDLGKLMTEQSREGGWIAVTPDALFLEKPQLSDTILDLRPLATGSEASSNLPTLQLTANLPPAAGRTVPNFRLSKAVWGAADFAIWRNMEDASILRARKKRRRPSEDRRGEAGLRGQLAQSSNRQVAAPADASRTSLIVALIRYFLAGWLWFPLLGAGSAYGTPAYGWVPTNVRSDGGAIGSVMLLEDDDAQHSDSSGSDTTGSAEHVAPAATRAHKSLSTSTQADSSASSGLRARNAGRDRSGSSISSSSRAFEEDEDPLIAAAGGSLASRRRRSVVNVGDIFSAQSASQSGILRDGQPAQARLADALFQEWSSWAQSVRQDVLAKVREMRDVRPAPPLHEIGHRVMREMDLSARSDWDVDLVVKLAEREGLKLQIRRPWGWSFGFF